MKQDAVMLQLPTRELAVMLDKDMIIFNIDLKQTGEIKWSEPPVDIGESVWPSSKAATTDLSRFSIHPRITKVCAV